MRTIFLISIILMISLGCTPKHEKNCYPKEIVAKIIIFVADTTIMGRIFVPNNDTIETYPVFNGIGFVKRDGTPVHKPLKTFELVEKQQEDFLKILRPIPQLNEGTTTSCIPYYRHVILFYNKTSHLIGQMHICFDCKQVKFRPEPDCLNYFDNVRLKEIESFFEENQVPRL